jgi:tetratricopeptide (TPR) repeat protein
MSMFLEQQLAMDDPRRQVVHDHFSRNLDDILGVAENAGCPVVLSTVASNLRDCAPFASLHRKAMPPDRKAEFDVLFPVAITNESAGNIETAMAKYRRAMALDDSFAEVDFRLGQCLLRQNNIAEASKAFSKARNNDALPFRADSMINELIRQAAARHQDRKVRLFDAEGLLERFAEQGAPGAEFFFEHVHLNFAGNYRLARAMGEVIEPLLTSAVTQTRAADWASQEACERRLGLTGWNRVGVLEEVLRRIQVAPFTQQANHPAQLKHWQAELKALRAELTPARAVEARALYREALLRAPRDYRLYEDYAEFLEATGAIEEAAVQWQAVCGLLPHHFAAYVHAGRLLGRQKQWSAAEQHLRTALALEPRSGEGHLELGRVLADQGHLEDAIGQYQEAIRWQPGNARTYLHLANALAQKDQRSAATEALHKAVQIQPSFWEARYLLGVELALNDRIPEAQKEFEEVLRARPDHPLAHLNLGVALARQGALAGARLHFEETLRLDPQNLKARQCLESLASMVPAPPLRPP